MAGGGDWGGTRIDTRDRYSDRNSGPGEPGSRDRYSDRNSGPGEIRSRCQRPSVYASTNWCKNNRSIGNSPRNTSTIHGSTRRITKNSSKRHILTLMTRSSHAPRAETKMRAFPSWGPPTMHGYAVTNSEEKRCHSLSRPTLVPLMLLGLENKCEHFLPGGRPPCTATP